MRSRGVRGNDCNYGRLDAIQWNDWARQSAEPRAKHRAVLFQRTVPEPGEMEARARWSGTGCRAIDSAAGIRIRSAEEFRIRSPARSACDGGSFGAAIAHDRHGRPSLRLVRHTAECA